MRRKCRRTLAGLGSKRGKAKKKKKISIHAKSYTLGDVEIRYVDLIEGRGFLEERGGMIGEKSRKKNYGELGKGNSKRGFDEKTSVG